jgi:hypothetical protein
MHHLQQTRRTGCATGGLLQTRAFRRLMRVADLRLYHGVVIAPARGSNPHSITPAPPAGTGGHRPCEAVAILGGAHPPQLQRGALTCRPVPGDASSMRFSS